MRGFIVLGAGLALTGCDLLPFGRDARGPAPAPTVQPAPPPAASAPSRAPQVTTPPRGVTATAAALDTVPEAEKARAREAAAAAPAAALGDETVGLGDPTDPGLWVKTGLVTAETPGTVTTGGGEAVAVTLRPLDGAGGAQISLSALQALGLPLAGLHPVTVARAQ